MPIFTKYESVLLDQQDVYDVLRQILKNTQAKKKQSVERTKQKGYPQGKNRLLFCPKLYHMDQKLHFKT